MFARAVEMTTSSSSKLILLSERDIDSTPLSGPGLTAPPGDMQFTYDSAHSFIPYVNSYHASRPGIDPPPHPCQIIPCGAHALIEDDHFA